VYILPRSEGALEDLQWVLREVVSSAGEATLCEARFVDGLTDDEIERRFQEARDEDYQTVANEVREAMEKFADSERADFGGEKLGADLVRLERRLEEIGSIDFFNAPARESAAGLLRSLREQVEGRQRHEPKRLFSRISRRFSGKVWVTALAYTSTACQCLARSSARGSQRRVQVRSASWLSPARKRTALRHVRGRIHPRGDLCTLKCCSSASASLRPGSVRSPR